MKALKLIAVNLLSVLYIPLFLFSTVSILISRALSKTHIIVLSGLGIALLTFIHNLISFDDVRFRMAMLFFFLLLFIILFVLAVMFASAAIISAATIIASFFDFLHKVSNDLCDAILNKCEALMLNKSDGQKSSAMTCPVFVFAKLLRKMVITVFSKAGILAVIAGVFIIIGIPILLHFRFLNDYGVGLIGFLKLFPIVEIIFTVFYALTIMAAATTIILKLGLEWSDWGTEELSKESAKATA